MKKTLLTLLTILIALTTTAQQQGINYKALIKDNSGNIITTLIEIQFNVLEASPTGTVIFSRAQTVTPDANGLIILDIASGPNPPSIGDFTTIDWASNTHFLNVQIKTGATFLDMGTTQFMAVPYAKHANTATTVLNGVTSINDLSDGKSDNDGTNNGSSLFLGIDAGAIDDGTDNRNVGVGFQALNSNTTGNDNAANGTQALQSNTTGDFNTANGSEALYSNTTGDRNTANGYQALYKNQGVDGLFSEGSNNTANGYQALYENTTGDGNTANGSLSLYSNTIGFYNTANGYRALSSNTTGSGNVALGYSAGSNETGSNKLYIANSSTSTPLIYGDFSTNRLTINGTINSLNNANPDIVLGGNSNTTTGDDGIIASDPAYAGSDLFIRSNDAVVIQLDFDNNEAGQFEIKNGTQVEVFEVRESGNATLSGSLTQNSDRRLKKDIENLPYGLKEILQLQPKIYNWKNRTQEHKSLGLIAQDVQPIIKEIVNASDDEMKTLGISYSELIPILINAIKEQDKVIKSLQLSVSSLQSTVGSQKLEFNNLNKRMEALEALLITKAENKVEVASEK